MRIKDERDEPVEHRSWGSQTITRSIYSLPVTPITIKFIDFIYQYGNTAQCNSNIITLTPLRNI